MKFEFNWPSGLRGENDNGASTESLVYLEFTLGAFGSGELKTLN